jgi:ATP-dependent Lon protease
MVFVGNIDHDIDYLLKTSSLFEPFPEKMVDCAFFDRMHCYIPGWEIPKMKPEYFTDNYGYISDYFAEALRILRKTSYKDAFDKYFKLGHCINQRDSIAVRTMVSALTKLIYPDGMFGETEIEEILKYSLESRRRVKEQLKKLGGMELYDTQFSYIRLSDMKEMYVNVLEQRATNLITEGKLKPGHVYTLGLGSNGVVGVFRLETQVSQGNGKFTVTGLNNSKEAKDGISTSEKYYKANYRSISQTINVEGNDFALHIQDLQGVGLASPISISTLVAFCSASLNKPVQSQLCIIGSFTIGGTIEKVDNLAKWLQVCLDAGAKKVLIPSSSVVDLSSVPSDLIIKFQTSFYSSPEDAVIKALGME